MRDLPAVLNLPGQVHRLLVSNQRLSIICRGVAPREPAVPPMAMPPPPPPPRRGVGGSKVKHKFVYLKLASNFLAPLIIFIFSPRKFFLMWVRGSVGWGWPGPPGS